MFFSKYYSVLLFERYFDYFDNNLLSKGPNEILLNLRNQLSVKFKHWARGQLELRDNLPAMTFRSLGPFLIFNLHYFNTNKCKNELLWPKTLFV